MLLRKRIPLAAVLVLIVACTRDGGSPTGPETVPSGGPAMGIYDGAHNGGRAGFYFLPPLVKQPTVSGTFDATLSPEVRVCELSGTTCVAGPPIASWTTTSGTGGAVVTVNAATQRYEVNWDTKLTTLDPSRYYRIVVSVGSVELGYADVDPVSSGSELKNVNTNEYIALKDGRTLPIAFRIETGTVGTLTVSPARDTVAVGGSAVFTATVTDLHGNPIPGAPIAWSSSNTAVATVSPATGASTTATAAASLPAQDSARIIATSGSMQGSAVLTVTAQTGPDAVDDAYAVARNGTVGAPPSADSLLDNDLRGTPAAEIDSVGGGFLGGGVTAFHVSPSTGFTVSPLPGYTSGSLTVFRDGAFSFTPPADSTGVFTFRYLLKNAAGSDSATVTITVDGPPTVTSNSPLDGAAGVADSINIVINFSEPVTAAAGAFALECPVGTPVAFTQSASPAASYTLDPSAALPWGTACRVTVDATRITDLGPTPQHLSPGNHVFTFTVDDVPSVTSTTPADSADDVLPDADIVIQFSESVNATTASFTIDCGTTQPFALSASPSATFTLNPTNQLPIGGSCTVTVHAAGITDADAGDPPDAMAADYTFSFSVPIVATDDVYPETVTGNLLHNSGNITTPFTVIANDQYGSPVQISAAGGSTTVASGAITGTTANGGTIVMTTDGTDVGKFTYDPPRGYEGADQFTYTIQLVSNPASTATATVTLAVSGMVWFIDNGSGCASACDGRFTHPYTTLAGFAGDNGGGGGNPAAGDHVFLYERATAYTGPVTLLNNQRLIGQDASQSLAALTGITPTSGSTPFPATNAANATQVQVDGGGITLAQNNRVHGLRLATSTGTGILGANIVTLTVDDVKILASGAAALSLASGTVTLSLDSVSSSGGARNVSLVAVAGTASLGTGALSGSTAAAFHDSAGSAVVTYAGSIAATGAARSASLRNRTGGSVTLSGNLADTGAGVLVQGNSAGTISFTGASKTVSTGANPAVSLVGNTGTSIVFGGGGLVITTTTGAGLSATGGGTLQVTGAVNTIASTGGVALNVQNTTIGASGLSFQSISANGGANGIVLVSTGSTNGLQVTGTGTAGSGGTIVNTTGSDGALAGNGVYLSSARNVNLSWMNLSGHANNGLYGTGVRGLTMNKVRFTGNNGTSNSGTFNESAVHLVDVGGPVKLTNSVFNGGAMNGVRVDNSLGTAPALDSLVLANDTVSHIQGSTADIRGSGLLVSLMDGTADTRIRDNHITYWWGNGIHVLVQGTASGTSRITSNFVDNTNGALAGAGGIWVAGGSHTYNISGNTVRHTNGTPISADRVNFGSLMNGTIDNNTIGVSGDANSGSATGIGIFASHHGPGTTTVKISNNVLRQINGSANGAITTQTGDALAFGGSGTMNATITGNNIQESGTTANNAQHGILITHGMQSGPPTDTDTGCYDVLNNTIVNFVNGTANNRIRVNQRFGTTSRWPGYTGAATGVTSQTDMASYLLGRNTASTSTNANTSTGGFLNTSPAGSACPQPSL